MTNVAPKVTMDAVAQTSTLDLYVGQFKVATYSYANGMITVAQLPAALFLDNQAVNDLVAGKRDWIIHMFKAGYTLLKDILTHPPIGKNIVYADQYSEDASFFRGEVIVGSTTIPGGSHLGTTTTFRYEYDKNTKLTKVFAHDQFVWTPNEYYVFLSCIIRGLDRVNADV